MLFVESTEKLKPVIFVKLNTNLPPESEGLVNCERIGAGMLNPALVIPVKPLDVKLMGAPLTALALNAVRSGKAFVPLTELRILVPPSVHVLWTAAAVILAELLVT